MRHIWIWLVVCVLFFQTVHTEYACSQGSTAYEWTLEPEEDGDLHVLVKVTMGPGMRSYPMKFPKITPVKNMKAWEAESGKPMDVKETDKGNRVEYEIDLLGKKGGGFQFFVEYTVSNMVVNMFDLTWYFYWSVTSELSSSHTATVILPKGHELLYTDELDPVEVSSRGGTYSVVFDEDVPENGIFKFGVMFSKIGAQLLKDAESNFRMKKYKEAKRKYEDAIEFYSVFEELYGKDKEEFLGDLRERVTECDVKAEEESLQSDTAVAEEKYQEAVAAFNDKEYGKAQQLFQEAQNKYLTVGDSEKADECQGYIDQCTQLFEEQLLRSDAEALFNEGVTFFEQQQCEEAKAKFEEALAKFTELQDQEKIQKCQEYIDSCETVSESEEPESEDGGACMGSTLVFAAMLGAALISMFKSSRNT